MLSSILSQGHIAIKQDTILFMANRIDSAREGTRNAGKPYLHGSFVGKNGDGTWTSQKLIHVFPTMSHMEAIGKVLEEDKFFLVTGAYDERETDAGNPVLSMGEARFARFDDNGSFTFSEPDPKKPGESQSVTISGEPGSFVTVELQVQAEFRAAETLSGTRPRREKLQVRRGQGMGMGNPQPEAQPNPQPEAQPVG